MSLKFPLMELNKKMKLTIEVEDLTLFTKCLNNACLSYFDILHSAWLGCEIPFKFEHLKHISEEEMNARKKCLHDVYKQVEQICDEHVNK